MHLIYEAFMPTAHMQKALIAILFIVTTERAFFRSPRANGRTESEGESFSVVNGGAAQAEVFSDFIGTSMCQGVNGRDRR